MKNKLQILLWVVILFVGIMLAWTLRLEAEDNKTEWNTGLIYDTTNVCYEGTIKWIVLSNPSLIGRMPNYQSQRQMIEHCFCVMDRIRNEFSREEYKKMVYNPEWAGTLFMTRAMECVRDKKTLSSFFTTELLEDNKTITEPQIKSDQQKELEEVPELIFQG